MQNNPSSSVKRLSLAFFTVATMAALLLSACGGSSSAANGPVTLTFGWWSNGPAKDAKFNAWVQSYTTTHPNVTIKTEFLGFGDYFTKLKTSIAGGTAYDIDAQCSCAMAYYYQNDAFVDLSKFSDYASASATLSSSAKALTTWNGKVYGLPLGLATGVLGYNKALFASAGIATPDPTKPLTITQFAAIAKQLNVRNSAGKTTQAGYTAGSSNFDASDTLEIFLENQGVQLFDNFVNPKKVTVNTTAGIQGLTDWVNFAKAGEPGPDELDSFNAGISGLQSGKVAITDSGPWEFSQYDAAKYGVMLFPGLDNGTYAHRAGTNSLGIYKGSQHQQAAWEFLKWAAQTPQELAFSTFSDVPAEQNAFNQFQSVIQPAAFFPTLKAAADGNRPNLLTPSQQIGTDIQNILTDLLRGKITPTQAAAKLESQGNNDLANP